MGETLARCDRAGEGTLHEFPGTRCAVIGRARALATPTSHFGFCCRCAIHRVRAEPFTVQGCRPVPAPRASKVHVSPFSIVLCATPGRMVARGESGRRRVATVPSACIEVARTANRQYSEVYIAARSAWGTVARVTDGASGEWDVARRLKRAESSMMSRGLRATGRGFCAIGVKFFLTCHNVGVGFCSERW